MYILNSRQVDIVRLSGVEYLDWPMNLATRFRDFLVSNAIYSIEISTFHDLFSAWASLLAYLE